jgi:hypothetical protein
MEHCRQINEKSGQPHQNEFELIELKATCPAS